MPKNRNIPQATKDNILHYVNQVYDEAYELGYQHGKRQGESDIEKTQRMIEDAVESLKELTLNQSKLPKHCIVPTGDYVATAGAPKRGKWIEIDEYSECSCCGAESCVETPFCPYCGARMESDER